ncbi:MAG: hypothetical protein V4533_15185 [Pseudomonadota bacterium]|jgi:hypothetical protein
MATHPPKFMDVRNLNDRKAVIAERESYAEAMIQYLLTALTILVTAILAIPLSLFLLSVYFVDFFSGRAPTMGKINLKLTRWR